MVQNLFNNRFLQVRLKLSPSNLFVLGVYLNVKVRVHLLFYVFVILLFIYMHEWLIKKKIRINPKLCVWKSLGFSESKGVSFLRI
jgi:hypothetical protein